MEKKKITKINEFTARNINYLIFDHRKSSSRLAKNPVVILIFMQFSFVIVVILKLVNFLARAANKNSRLRVQNNFLTLCEFTTARHVLLVELSKKRENRMQNT